MIRRILTGLLVLLLVLGGGLYLYLLSSLPQTDGRLAVPGPKAEIRIERDADGVPLIIAQDDEDAAFGLGFVHAQDRLFQMELQRRYGAGRLAEIFGTEALATDRQMRVLGLYRAAEAEIPFLSTEVRRGLEAYAAGVNAFLASRRGALPPEFLLLRFAPEPWRPADSLVWGKLMAVRLGGNYRGELLRARMARTVSAADLALLYPEYPKDAPTTLSDMLPIYRRLALDLLYEALPPVVGPIYASNNWVVDGATQRQRQAAPRQRSASRLRRAGLLVSRPAKDAAARDRRRDRRRQSVCPGRPQRADRLGFDDDHGRCRGSLHREGRPGRSRPLSDAARQRAVRVAARDDPRTRRARRSTLTIRDNPARSGVVRCPCRLERPIRGLSWRSPRPSRSPKTAAPRRFGSINRAADWPSFRAALRNFVGPMQNIVYGDVDGTIGFIAPGLVPIRAQRRRLAAGAGMDRRIRLDRVHPVRGAAAARPTRLRVISSAPTTRSCRTGYPYFLSRDWDLPNRAERIEALLAATPMQTPASSAAIQADTLSLMAQRLVPLMTRIDRRGRDVDARRSIVCARWDFHMDRDKVEPLLFTAWLREFSRAILFGRLGDAAPGYWDLKPQVMEAVLTEHAGLVRRPEAARSTRAALRGLRDALDAALAQLRQAYGADMTQWQWGRAHVAVFANPVFSRIPVLRDWLGVAIPTSGGYDTLNRGPSTIRDDAQPFAQRFGAGLRIITDLAAPSDARMMVTPGQSGNPLSGSFRRSAAALARFRLARARPIRRSRDPCLGAGAMNDLIVKDCSLSWNTSSFQLSITFTPPPPARGGEREGPGAT